MMACWPIGSISLFSEELLMPNKLAKRRHQAFLTQDKRCYYCGFLMWETDPAQFAKNHGLTLAQVQRFKCTAEHLEARQDGGNDLPSNIVAACIHCNQSRHRMKPALSAEMYCRVISKQLLNGSWHKQKVVKKLHQAMAPDFRNLAY